MIISEWFDRYEKEMCFAARKNGEDRVNIVDAFFRLYYDYQLTVYLLTPSNSFTKSSTQLGVLSRNNSLSTIQPVAVTVGNGRSIIKHILGPLTDKVRIAAASAVRASAEPGSATANLAAAIVAGVAVTTSRQADVDETLGAHGATLGNHEEKLNAQGAAQANQQAQLDAQGATQGTHGATLGTHGDKLVDHGRALEQLSREVRGATALSMRVQGGLSQLNDKLDAFVRKFEEAGQTAPAQEEEEEVCCVCGNPQGQEPIQGFCADVRHALCNTCMTRVLQIERCPKRCPCRCRPWGLGQLRWFKSPSESGPAVCPPVAAASPDSTPQYSPASPPTSRDQSPVRSRSRSPGIQDAEAGEGRGRRGRRAGRGPTTRSTPTDDAEMARALALSEQEDKAKVLPDDEYDAQLKAQIAASERCVREEAAVRRLGGGP